MNGVDMQPLSLSAGIRTSSITNLKFNYWKLIEGVEVRSLPSFDFLCFPEIKLEYIDLSLFCNFSLFFFNYYFISKNLIFVSAQNGSSAQLWASLVHFKSRL